MKATTPDMDAQAREILGWARRKLAMALLDKAGVAYTALNANENKELVGEYGVKQAPTLVLIGEDGFESYRGVSDIKGWLMGKK